MSVSSRTCITVTCDRCGNEGEDDDSGFTPHFDSVEQAVERLTGDSGYGWALVGDPQGGIWTCASCTARATCEASGHALSRWFHCRCLGGIDGHPTDLNHVPRHRTCDRCEHFEREHQVGEAS